MNVVTEQQGTPCAVLLRGGQAISPLDSLSQQRYGKNYNSLTTYQKKNFSNGPAKLAKALAITKQCFDNGLIIERAGRKNSVIKLMPALTISDELLMKGLDIIKNAVKAQ